MQRCCGFAHRVDGVINVEIIPALFNVKRCKHERDRFARVGARQAPAAILGVLELTMVDFTVVYYAYTRTARVSWWRRNRARVSTAEDCTEAIPVDRVI